MKNKILKGIATLMAAVMLIGTAAVIPAQEVNATWADRYEYIYNSTYHSVPWSSLTDTQKENWVYTNYIGYGSWVGYPTYPAYSDYYNYNFNYYYNYYITNSSNAEFSAADKAAYGVDSWNEMSIANRWKWVYDNKGFDYYYYYGYPYYYYYGYPYSGPINIVSTETEKKPAKNQSSNNVKTTYMSTALVDKALKLIKNCESGENVSITMGKATHIDSDIMAALQGRNVTVYAKKGAYSWFINGKDIKDSSIDANIACTVDAGNIPEKLTKKFKGETVEISTVANSLTFKGYLYASIGYEGDKVDVYKYDGETLKKIATVTVDSDDEAGVKVTTGGDYLFVVK